MDRCVGGANELRGRRPSRESAKQGDDQEADAGSDHAPIGESAGSFDRGMVQRPSGVRGRRAGHPVTPGAGRGKRIDGIVGGVHGKDCRCFEHPVGIESF